MAVRLKAAIKEATRLTASAGVSPNEFLTKIASSWQKPDGLTVSAPERVETFLQKLPVDALWAVGPVTAARLRERGTVRLVAESGGSGTPVDGETLRRAGPSANSWPSGQSIGRRVAKESHDGPQFRRRHRGRGAAWD